MHEVPAIRMISGIAHVNRRVMLHVAVKEPFVRCVQAESCTLEMTRGDYRSQNPDMS
jgi:hypothetical protein